METKSLKIDENSGNFDKLHKPSMDSIWFEDKSRRFNLVKLYTPFKFWIWYGYSLLTESFNPSCPFEFSPHNHTCLLTASKAPNEYSPYAM